MQQNESGEPCAICRQERANARMAMERALLDALPEEAKLRIREGRSARRAETKARIEAGARRWAIENPKAAKDLANRSIEEIRALINRGREEYRDAKRLHDAWECTGRRHRRRN